MTNLGTLIQSAIRLTKNGPVLHPLLIALYPAVFLWSNNVENLSLSAGPLDLMVSMGIPVVFALVAVLFLGFILRDRKKAGLVVALFLLLFFSYGRILELSADFGHIRHRYLLLASGGLFAAGVYWSIATRVDLRNITSFLNAAAIVLVAIPLVNILAYSFRSETPSIGEVVDKSVRPTDLGTLPADLGTLPDIYYIILDAYASSQNLKGNFGFDNQQFTDFLTEKGFYIAPESPTPTTPTRPYLSHPL